MICCPIACVAGRAGGARHARTNAQVIIKQNGYTIYQSYVSPGAFEITDMYPTGSSGDLGRHTKEADGSEQHQTVACLLRLFCSEGRLKYSVTSGQYQFYESDIDSKCLPVPP